MSLKEPTHDSGPRTTATSNLEGRLKIGINNGITQRRIKHKKKYGSLNNFPKKRKYLKRKLR